MNEHDDAIEKRQIELVLRQIPKGNASAVIVALLICAICVPQLGLLRCLSWFSLVAVSFAARMWLLRSAAPRLGNGTSAARVGRELATIHALIGIAVASAAWWFYGALDARVELLLTLVLISWPAGGIAVLGMHYRSYQVYLAGYFVTLGSAWWHFHPGERLVVLAIAVFIAILASLARMLSTQIGEIWMLEREKDSLLRTETELSHRLSAEKERALQANLAKSRFLAAASHDLRQPVQALSLLSGVLQGIVRDAQVVEISTQIARASASLDQLFTAILDISRLEAGEIKPRCSFFPLAPLIARLHSEYVAKARVRGLEFHVRSLPIEIETDPALFERLLRNLLENAIRYTREGSVTVHLERTAESFQLTVEDTGIGIQENDLDRIFHDYYRVAGGNEPGEIGIGLGLSIVRRLCDLLDMTIDVSSKAGHGSVFRIHGGTTRIRENTSDSPPVVGTTHIDLSGIHAMVVDDDDAVRVALATTLERWGGRVDQCASLVDVERLLGGDRSAIDIAVVDYRLAEGPVGFRVAQRIRDAHANVVVLMMTGELQLDEEAARKAHVILRKPLSHAAFARHVAAALAARMGKEQITANA